MSFPDAMLTVLGMFSIPGNVASDENTCHALAPIEHAYSNTSESCVSLLRILYCCSHPIPDPDRVLYELITALHLAVNALPTLGPQLSPLAASIAPTLSCETRLLS